MTVPLIDHLDFLRQRMADRAHLLVALDLDRTFSTDTDATDADLASEQRALLKSLAKRAQTTVVITSGRSLYQLRRMVLLEELIYVGNHGLEIYGPNLHFVQPIAAKKSRALGYLAVALAHGLAQFDGVFVENKGLTVSVHYRHVASVQVEEIFHHVLAAASVMPDCFRVDLGEGFFEIHPGVAWNIALAMDWIACKRKLENSLAIVVGTDPMDKDGFSVLTDAIIVTVGQEINADYHIEDREGVCQLLRWLGCRSEK